MLRYGLRKCFLLLGRSSTVISGIHSDLYVLRMLRENVGIFPSAVFQGTAGLGISTGQNELAV